MFKVGDRVEYKGFPNLTLTIKKTKGKNGWIIGRWDGSGNMSVWHKAIDFVLAEPQYTWISKFNIGDKVVDDLGYKSVIERVAFNGKDIQYVCKLYINSERTRLCEGQLSLYKEPTVKEMTVGEVEKELGYTIKIIKEG